MPFVAEHVADGLGRICSAGDVIGKQLHDEFGGQMEAANCALKSPTH